MPTIHSLTETLAEIEHQAQFTNDNFPCLVKGGCEIENADQARNKQERYERIARNGLRNLTYGISLTKAHLVTWDNFKALVIKRDPHLFVALRKEMQNIFENANQYLQENKFDADSEKRLEIFLNNILSAYPFLDPQQNEIMRIPTRINHTWEMVEYRCDKVDISPQKGLLSKLLEDNDRLYAYGLVPTTSAAAKPYLVVMGTAYPSGQGADLNYLYNIKPRNSVGEGHDLTNVETWLEQFDKVNVTGHSKGGTLAMIIAARFPKKIQSAYCLNPTALSQATLKRLSPSWDVIPNEDKPKINVYTQMNDPVFLLESNFLKTTKIYLLGQKTESYGLLEAHAHYLSGRKYTAILEVNNPETFVISKRRRFAVEVKELFTLILFPAMYTKLVYKLSANKIKAFFDKHELLFKSIIFAATFFSLVGMASSGVLAPVAVALAAKLGLGLAVTVMSVAGIAGSALFAHLVPALTKVMADTLSAIVFTAAAAVTLAATAVIGGLIAMGKMVVEAVVDCLKPPADHVANLIVESLVQLKDGSTTKIWKKLAVNQTGYQQLEVEADVPMSLKIIHHSTSATVKPVMSKEEEKRYPFKR